MSEKEKQKKPLDVEEKAASKIADGVAGTSVGIAKTIEEVVTAPIRVAGRVIDGSVQGFKHGVENSSNPIEKVAKPLMDGVVGAVKGAVKGIEVSANKIGKSVDEVGENISKVGKTMSGEE